MAITNGFANPREWNEDLHSLPLMSRFFIRCGISLNLKVTITYLSYGSFNYLYICLIDDSVHNNPDHRLVTHEVLKTIHHLHVTVYHYESLCRLTLLSSTTILFGLISNWRLSKVEVQRRIPIRTSYFIGTWLFC